MARHIMAVCVVCLLCADRIPCQEHVINDYVANAAAATAYPPPHFEYQQLNARVHERRDAARFGVDPLTGGAHNRADELDIETTSNNVHNKPHRRKRHAGHAHGEETSHVVQRPEITAEFLQRIFVEYGHKADGTLTVEEFQRILKKLGLNQLIEGAPQQKQQQQQEQTAQRLQHPAEDKQQAPSNGTCVTDAALVYHVQPHKIVEHTHPHIEHAVNCTDSSATDCAHAQQNHQKHIGLHEHASNYTISKDDMLHLCPVLLYQMASPLIGERDGCIDPSILEDVEEFEASEYDAKKEDMFYVWTYAFISVFACGILGLVGVAIIPFMDSRYYKYIIQYLVALAVGTMTGDALLHLLPHSLAGQSEQNMILKGLGCMSGIVFFYMTEHGLTMISEWRKRIAKSDTKQQSRAKVVRDPDSSVNNSVAGDKLCKSKYSSYPYCYDEIAMDTKNDMHLPGSKLNNISDLSGELMGGVSNNVERKRNGKADAEDNDAVAQSLIPVWHHNHQDHQHQQPPHHHIHLPDSNTISTDLDGNSMGGGDGHSHALVYNPTVTTNGNAKDHSLVSDSVPTVILREHESSHHGHSHKHGHVHSPPESLSAVVWMIIMGDGLHNFTDGMAIGAAFAENIAGGFSTSLAVFCHELPHELGDFAILIKAGMSIKTAVYYNLLTSVLSFFGMIIGIIFGQSPNVAQWMFAVAAGLFIYIALVDMMPELSSAHKTVEQFLLQIFGMCTGVAIMLLIALYEGDLLSVFSSSAPTTATTHKH
ncbi:zinc transporter foi [Zeugodacus cucurbitae]|uniref:zinc transporter foi n=1 Tax=Zeugodacus cucurbitae TaxID=28588 RepID=UPI000596A847|nr:zinc transporter foi [Zeugodacus cucurbitae]XP_054086316.1 zinc transporter foi [Zeugodacus cucurbitae]XP_054086317.1 zinc transporter foi [Zeugodacus cucurbitae]XP_054086318.1 zinc transporter foi [Zeugodacus cucurbitae]